MHCECSFQEYDIVDNPLTDVFGQSLYGALANKIIAESLCTCPVCHRSLCASRYAVFSSCTVCSQKLPWFSNPTRTFEGYHFA